jgi:elongation factor 1-gamma
VHCVTGEEGDYDINGVWLWRGTDKLVCIDENPLAEYYFYKKLDPSKEEDRKLIGEYFTLSESDWGTKKVNGQTLIFHEEFK